MMRLLLTFLVVGSLFGISTSGPLYAGPKGGKSKSRSSLTPSLDEARDILSGKSGGAGGKGKEGGKEIDPKVRAMERRVEAELKKLEAEKSLPPGPYRDKKVQSTTKSLEQKKRDLENAREESRRKKKDDARR